MALTRSTVARGLVLLEPDGSGVDQMVMVEAAVALARCQRCGTCRRVLPCDALARKTYGLAVIEQEISDYSRGDRSLRQVAWSQLGERTPAHTTLHGWSEGLGAHALGRPGGELGGAPISRLIAEAEPRVPGIVEVLRSEPEPDPRRYRSKARRARLAAVNPEVDVVRHRTRVTSTTAADLVAAYDVIADGSDNFATPRQNAR